MLYADNLVVAVLILSMDGLTLALAKETSSWMMCSVQELNLTFGTVRTLAGTKMTADTMKMSVSSVQVKKYINLYLENFLWIFLSTVKMRNIQKSDWS